MLYLKKQSHRIKGVEEVEVTLLVGAEAELLRIIRPIMPHGVGEEDFLKTVGVQVEEGVDSKEGRR